MTSWRENSKSGLTEGDPIRCGESESWNALLSDGVTFRVLVLRIVRLVFLTRTTALMRQLRNTVPHVVGENLVDQRLIADVPAPRFLSERLQHARINADRDQTAGFFPNRRTPDPAHCLQLFGGCLGNV
jgi:hypothetical protein